MCPFPNRLIKLVLVLCSAPLLFGCRNPSSGATEDYTVPEQAATTDRHQITVGTSVTMGQYFDFMDSVATLGSVPLSEHLVVWNNPWIMDTLAHTDYYRMPFRDSLLGDPKDLVILPKGTILYLPDSLTSASLQKQMDALSIDINIPEFKLRILQDSVLLFSFPIRVGQNRSRYLAMGHRVTDLRTKTGSGTIIRHNKHPDFYNPVDGKRFFMTKRDDGKTTAMPLIPWIETEINGVRNGQLIHPTTNPVTLGKAYSNGCIGVREADAWIIYYHAPIGTKITIRYDLSVFGANKDSLRQKNIYNRPLPLGPEQTLPNKRENFQ